MAGSIGSIYVDILLRDGKYAEGWNRARSTTRSALSGIQSDLDRTSKAFTAVINPVNNLASSVQELWYTLAAALSVDKIVRYSDTWRQLTGRLGLVSSGMGDVAIKQEQLFRIAQETRQPLNGIIDFYTRLNQFIPETERKQYDLIGVTQSVAAAIAITGESTIAAQNALVQFTQGIGTNFEAAGQELRSLQELAPRLTRALQEALGDGTQSLQTLVKMGKITRESVLTALSGTGVEGRKLKDELARMPTTVGQALTKLDNAFLKFVGTSNGISAGTNSLAIALTALADNFKTLATAATFGAEVLGVGLVVKLGAVTKGFLEAKSAAQALAAANASLATTNAIGVVAPTMRRTRGVSDAAGIVAMGAGAKEVSNAFGNMGNVFSTTATSITKNAAKIDSSFGIASASALAFNGSVTATTLAASKATATYTGMTVATRVLAGATALATGAATALMAIYTALGGWIGITAIAAIAAYTLKTDDAAEAQDKYRKAIADSRTELAGFQTQNAVSQLEALTATSNRMYAAMLDRERLQKLIDEKKNSGWFSQAGGDLLAAFGFGEGTIESLQSRLDTATDAVKTFSSELNAALAPHEKGAFGYTQAQLEALAKNAQRYAAQLRGVTQEALDQEEALATLKQLKEEGYFLKGAGGDEAQAAKNYAKAIDDVKQKYRESTKEYKDAKKSAEELKQIYEEFRPAIQGISKEQDTYNQNLIKLNKIRESIGEEAYTRALKAEQDVLNKTAEKQKEAEGTYEKYETYLTGLTEQQIKYNQAQKELQGLVGKDVKGTTISQEQADTALKRYENSLKDSEEKTKDWAKMAEEMGKRAADNIQDAFADFLYDPFKDGMDGMVVNFANAIRKMYAELLASQLFKLINQGVGDGGLGGFISSLFGGSSGSAINLSTGASSNTSSFLSAGNVGSTSGINFAGFFADGGYVGPGKWGIAGEAGAELIYGGNTGATVIPQNGSAGGTVVNIINNNGSKVSTSSSKSGNTTTVDVMLDEAVANNMTKTGSRTRQAMGSYNQRALVRR